MGELHGRYHHVSVCVSDLDISTPTGLRQLFVDDPDGNRVEFIGPTRSPRTVRMEEGR